MGGASKLADEYGNMNSDGETALLEEFTLESGKIMSKVEVCYMTWGKLNEKKDNAIVIHHALTGNANVEAWWGSLLGPGRPFDTEKYWVFCANVLGSCYGTTGPASINTNTGKKYGSDWPKVTIRDIVQLQASVLRQIGVNEVACCIGGSMGGMQAIEWALDVHQPRARSFVSLCSNGRHQPWQIGISECQRQAIYADPKWNNGNYDKDDLPSSGLAVARMMAMQTYRTHPAYWTKFGRAMVTSQQKRIFDVESYLQSQGRKFLERGFDPATYIALTQSMDTHDIERGRGTYIETLRSINVPALIVSISSDVLYPLSEQLELAENIPRAQHHLIQSNEGHDGFLLEHEKMGMLIKGFLGMREMEELEMANAGSRSKL